jgi:catechol 2,3-dioxygenase-like lactoylglutathione lyase family enzyme
VIDKHQQYQQQQGSLAVRQSSSPHRRTKTTMAAVQADSPASAAAAGVNVVGADHIVLRVADPEASVHWYSSKLGLQPVRLQEYKDGKVPFPSVRVSSTFLIDFMKEKPADEQHEVQTGAAAAPANSGTKTSSSGGAAAANLDHICLVVGGDDIEQVKQQLAAVGVQAEQQFDGVVVKRFGAQGNALSIYVRIPIQTW